MEAAGEDEVGGTRRWRNQRERGARKVAGCVRVGEEVERPPIDLLHADETFSRGEPQCDTSVW